MKLPVKQILNKNKKHYQIIDKEGVIIIPDIPRLCDAMQIEDALNNFQIMCDLLKESLELIEILDDDEDCVTTNKIKKFLKQYEL